MLDSRNAIPAEKVAESHPSAKHARNEVPYSAEIAKAFGKLSAARIECGKNLDLESISDIVHDPDQFTQGVHLLADVGPEPLRGAYRQAASWMMPELIRSFPGIAEELRILESAFAQSPKLVDALFNMLANNDTEALVRFSATLGISERTFSFAGLEILKTCIQRAAELLGPLIADTPWSKGNCPICGSCPDMALLRPKAPEPSEYLVSKSGQLWLHCSLCAHQWRFLRSKCPHCGDTEPDGLLYYASAERRGERFYACSRCNRYFNCLDLTENDTETDMTLAPFSLIHLDCLAREKGFIPLAELPWNQFPGSSSADISSSRV